MSHIMLGGDKIRRSVRTEETNAARRDSNRQLEELEGKTQIVADTTIFILP